MNIRAQWQDGLFYVHLEGELDHHAAKETLTKAGQFLEEHVPLRCTLDMAGVSFMDSSGIAVVLGLDRRIRSYGGQLTVVNIPRQAARVLKTARINELVNLAL